MTATGLRHWRCPLAVWIWIAVAAVGCFIGALSAIRIDRINPSAGPDNLYCLWGYWLTFGVSWLVLGVVGLRLSQGHPAPTLQRRRRGESIVLAVAAIARFVTVFSTTPELSDDLWRYIHDGRRLSAGFDPYAQSPASLGAANGQDPILDRINHPHLVTIYQPVSQYVFALLWSIHPAKMDPLGIYTFRAGFVMFDLIIVGLLLYHLRCQGRSHWWAVMYAWHPLPISEIAGSGHQDVIGIAMGLAAIHLVRSPVVSLRGAFSSGLLFAGSIAVKPIVLPLAFPLAWALRHRLGAMLTAGAGTVTGGAMAYGPLLFLGDGFGGLWTTITVFISQWHFNCSIHALVTCATGSLATANAVNIGVLLMVLGGCIARRLDLLRTAMVFMFASLLLSSTVYPWYLLWALAFVPIRFDLGVWVFGLTIAWSYAVLGNMAAWELPLWVLVVEYLPVYMAVTTQLVKSVRANRRRPITFP